ncbi:MAG TPA: TerB family tellurite resistance protein [Polyangiaceae bacterium]
MNFARIARLREKLLAAGQPSIRPPPPGPEEPLPPERGALYARVQPLAEVMFLVMSADGAIASDERAALLGMLRTLTDGALSSREMAQMLDDFGEGLAREGVEQRLDTLAARLYGEPEDRELALALAAATVLTDEQVQPGEAAILSSLAERLGVPEARARSLIEQTE